MTRKQCSIDGINWIQCECGGKTHPRFRLACEYGVGLLQCRYTCYEEYRRNYYQIPVRVDPTLADGQWRLETSTKKENKMGCGRKGMVWFSGAWKSCPGCSECPAYSNLLSPAKPITADAIQQMIKDMEALASNPFVPSTDFFGLGVGHLLDDPKYQGAIDGAKALGKSACEAIGYNAKAGVGDKTCLQLIQSRKPPEPWRPSVDEWDLLPDAGR